jgi:hypothetical protein
MARLMASITAPAVARITIQVFFVMVPPSEMKNPAFHFWNRRLDGK